MFKHFGFSSNTKILTKIGTVADNGFFILLTVIGAILLTIGGAYAGTFNLSDAIKKSTEASDYANIIFCSPITFFLLGGISSLCGGIGSYKDQSKQQKEIKTLKVENGKLPETRKALSATIEQLQQNKSELAHLHTELVQTWLLGTCKQFKLTTNDRVSIYYENDEEFFLLARYSKNPKLSKSHRQKFPLNKGVIGKAWEHGQHIDISCPPYSSKEPYDTHMKDQYDYESDKVANLTMKSCRYIAKAITDADIHIGVIVFESTNPNFIKDEDEGEGDNIKVQLLEYCDGHQSLLAKFVRDGFKYSKEVNLKPENKVQSVEDEFSSMLNNGGGK